MWTLGGDTSQPARRSSISIGCLHRHREQDGANWRAASRHGWKRVSRVQPAREAPEGTGERRAAVLFDRADGDGTRGGRGAVYRLVLGAPTGSRAARRAAAGSGVGRECRQGSARGGADPHGPLKQTAALLVPGEAERE